MADKPDIPQTENNENAAEQPVENNTTSEKKETPKVQPSVSEAQSLSEQDSKSSYKNIKNDPFYNQAIENLTKGMSSKERRMKGVFKAEDLDETKVLDEIIALKQTATQQETAEENAALNQLKLKADRILEIQKKYRDAGYDKELTQEEKDILNAYDNMKQGLSVVRNAPQAGKAIAQQMKMDVESGKKEQDQYLPPEIQQQLEEYNKLKEANQVTDDDVADLAAQSEAKKQALKDQLSDESAMEKIQREFMEKAQKQIKQINLDVKALRAMKPTDFWEDKGTWNKVLAGIGMLMGGAPAVKIVNDAINAHAQRFADSRERQLELIAQGREMVNMHLDHMSKNISNTEKLARIQQIKLENEKLKQAAVAQMAQQKARNSLISQGKLTWNILSDQEKEIILTGKNNLTQQYKSELDKLKIEETASAYEGLVTLLNKEGDFNGADDVALIFKYMKILDPTSVVREGEFDRAAIASPLLDRVNSYVRRLATGEILPNDEVRKTFADAVKQVAKGKINTLNRVNKRYSERVVDFNLPKGSEKFFVKKIKLSDLDPNMDRKQKLLQTAIQKGNVTDKKQQKKLESILLKKIRQ